MRAVRLNDWGIENIHAEDVADPTPTAGKVLIATEAATINPADVGPNSATRPMSVCDPFELRLDRPPALIRGRPSRAHNTDSMEAAY
jgi:hypothetical protein